MTTFPSHEPELGRLRQVSLYERISVRVHVYIVFRVRFWQQLNLLSASHGRAKPTLVSKSESSDSFLTY